MNKFSSIILAAGQGTRMKSEKCKVMHKISSKPLIKWVYEKAKKAGSGKTVMVVGHKKEQVMEYMGPDELYAVQEQRLGTGHAVMMTKEFFKDDDGIVVVFNGDTPLISDKLISDLVEYHKISGNAATVVSAVVDNPFGYGRVIKLSDGSLVKIVEQKDASEEEKKVCEINSGMYCFNTKDLFDALSKIKNDNAQSEYYLTDTISVLKGENKKVGAFVAPDYKEILGVNNRVDLAAAQKIKNDEIITKNMIAGVTIIDPQNTYIDDEVIIGSDTIIYPGSIIRGKTVIGSDCEIGPSSTLDDTVIGNGTTFKNSVAINAKIGDNTTVGPFAYIRPNSDIKNNVKIGDFVEVKNSVIGNGTKVSHLTYVGDSDVGEKINFGCGTITVNYDGKNKFRTVIEDNAFIGCNTNLVAPVKVGKGAFIAAGSTITDDVDDNALAIARSRQTVKKDWKKKN